MADRRDRETTGEGDTPTRDRTAADARDGTADGPGESPPAEGRQGEDSNDERDDMSGVFGPRDEPREILPGSPDPEHALFVLLGVLVGVASVLELVGAL